MKNFWKELKKPFFVLAPMDDVTDTVLRQIFSKIGKPDVLFTEFTSIDGMLSVQGAETVKRRLQYTEGERPIVAQIWGNDPQKFKEAARMLDELGFDGIDINMGCPDSGVIKKKMCSALIKNPSLVKEIVLAIKEGAPNIPVSIKTRIGFERIISEEWIGFLLTLDLAALTIHGRTVREMSKVPAHWDEIGKVVELRDKMGMETLIIGNGDVTSRVDGLEKVKKYGVDGVMVGRGIFTNPWIFNQDDVNPEFSEKLKILLEHAKLYESTWKDKKNFLTLRKFFKSYINGFEGASDIRAKFMEVENLEDVEKLVKNYSRIQ